MSPKKVAAKDLVGSQKGVKKLVAQTKPEALDGLDKQAPRRADRRNFEDKAARAIGLKCSEIPQHLQDNRLVNGQKLVERVADDYSKLAAGKKLSPKYWTALIKEWMAGVGEKEVEASTLKATEKNETVADGLLDALVEFDEPGNNGPLIKLLCGSAGLNQSEWVLVAKLMAKAHVPSMKNHDQLMGALMGLAASSNAKAKFATEIGVLNPLFDGALCAMWSDLKKEGVKLATFIELHLEELALILKREDLDAVVANKADLGPARLQLARLHNTGLKIARAMFAEHLVHFSSSDYSASVKDAVQKLFDQPKVTKASFEQTKKNLKQLAEDRATLLLQRL